jgi:tRNA threonylcarbamoyladenosine biosynthesis protein TsaB
VRIVAIETSGREGSLAVLLGEASAARPIGEAQLGCEQRTAQSLAPALQSLLAKVGWSPGSIELVAVVVGPGSFTGLRIGATAAKVLAYAVSAAVAGVDSLDVLAWQAATAAVPLWTIMDAQRQELFVAQFEADKDGGMVRKSRTAIISEQAWLAGLQPGDHVIGPALIRLRPRLPEGVIALPEPNWRPTAAAVGQVAWQAYRQGRRDDVWTLVPNYFRPSAPEERARRRGD